LRLKLLFVFVFSIEQPIDKTSEIKTAQGINNAGHKFDLR
jgi:hypothetical protein